jgi:protoporphyrinogen oxidase
LNQIELQDMKHPVVLALAPFEAVTLLDNSDPRQSILRSHERVGLGTATLCLSEDSKIPRGFGALFPAAEWPGGPLGVLFNSDIFDKRVADPSNRSETWIYPLRGSSAPTIEQVLQDRRKLFTSTPSQNKVVGFMSYAWPTALPSYSVNWERALDQLRGLPHNNRFLLGPSYGRIGLASVLRDSVDLARQLVNEKESR